MYQEPYKRYHSILEKNEKSFGKKKKKLDFKWKTKTHLLLFLLLLLLLFSSLLLLREPNQAEFSGFGFE